MRRLVLVLLGVGASLVFFVSLGVAGTQRAHKCSARDNKGNWEVVISHAATAKAAGKIQTNASAKGLHATTERDGCARRWEVVITDSTKAKAEATMKQAQKDGFKSVTIEKS
jgi:hypothetical protein